MKTKKQNRNIETFDEEGIKVEEEIFWLDKWEGKSHGGFFVRNSLIEFFEMCKKKGLKIVGIKKPNNWNLEIIVEENDKYKELYEK